MIQHVTPVNDLKGHEEYSHWLVSDHPICDCTCKPRRKYLSESDSWLFIHNSWDGREGVEWAAEIIGKVSG